MRYSNGRYFDKSLTRRFRLRIISGLLFFVTIAGCYYGLSHTTRADAINTTDFVTTWKTDNEGTSNSSSITIPTYPWGLTYNYSVDWNNDGTPDETGITGDVTHDFGTPGTYTIRISGDFPRIFFDASGDAKKILEVNQWGNIQWQSMYSAFAGASNLTIPAIDAPDLSQVTEMTQMFLWATSFNQPLDSWDVSNVTDMSNMFNGAYSFNQPLNSWDVSSVTNMYAMFSSTPFNQPLDSWDVSNVTDMSSMFNGAYSFNQPLDSWDVSNVTSMYGMFSGTPFDQPLDNWVTSSATNMSYMFNSSPFNQPLNSWDVSNVTNMSSMFRNNSFNRPLDSWDVSNVTDMSNMFNGAYSFNQPLDSWDVSNVTDMTDILSLSTLSVTNYDSTLLAWAAQPVQQGVLFGASGLRYCTAEAARQSLIDNHGWVITGDASCPPPASITGDFITTWKTDNEGTSNSSSITIPTYRWGGLTYNYSVDWNNDGTPDETGITGDVTHDFGTPGTYTIRISGDFPAIYFSNSGDVKKILEVNQWADIQWKKMESAFFGASNLTIPATDAPDLSQVTSTGSMFRGATSFNQPLNNWDMSNVTYTGNMFQGATSFNQPLNNWDMSNVTYTGSMFQGATSFNQPLNNWDVSKVSYAASMFEGATSFNGALNDWDVTSLSYPASMFKGATSFNQPLNNWDMSNVTYTGSMFQGATSFNQPLNNWDMSNVTYTGSMFQGATSFNQPLNNWDVSKVSYAASMFEGATSFNQSLDSWDVSGMGYMAGMLSGTGLSVKKYDALLTAWASQPLQQGVPFGVSGLTYCMAGAARQSLIDNYHWTITGDSQCTLPVTQTADFSVLGSNEDNAVSKAKLTVVSSDCYEILTPSLAVLGSSGISTSEPGVTIVGGLGYNLECNSPGGTSIATITLGRYFEDLSKLRIYKKTGSANLQDITNQVTIENRESETGLVTSIEYTLVDGAAFDEDGVANGTIVDPLYIGYFMTPGASDDLANTGVDSRLAIAVAVVAIVSGLWVLRRRIV